MSANLIMWLAGWFIVSCAAAPTSAPFDSAAFLKGVRAPADFTVALVLRDASGAETRDRFIHLQSLQ